MHVVVACDSFGGTLTASEATAAVAAGWGEARPDDDVSLVPMSDGGEGLLDVLHDSRATAITLEVCGPLGHPREAWFTLRPDGTAVIESAEACGLAWVAPPERNPLQATSWGVGELLDAARDVGAARILVGLGGSASVDGGAGALSALGFRLRVADGSGLKVGGEDLPRVASVESGWRHPDWDGIPVTLLADVTTCLEDAAAVFGPQKGATPVMVSHLTQGLRTWADVAERDLGAGRRVRDVPGTGAAGGLGFGLAVGLGADLVPGAETVADLVGLADAIGRADLVVTGEGRLDATSFVGKVVGTVAGHAAAAGVAVVAVIGTGDEDGPGLAAVERAAPAGPGPDPAGEVARAAARLARRWARGGPP
jgi:glycerate 2-kinase